MAKTKTTPPRRSSTDDDAVADVRPIGKGPLTPAGDGPETEVVVKGRALKGPDPLDDLKEGAPVPDPTLAKKMPPAPVAESDATAAAGPHRPEPAKQIFHNPGAPPVAPVADGTRAVSAGIKVMATADTYYGEARRRQGDVFTITSEAHFNKRCMVRVSASTPEKTSTGRDVLKKQHDEILGARATGDEARAGRGSARHTADDNPLDA